MPITVRSFCEATGIPARTVLGKLMMNVNMANLNINSNLDPEMAEAFHIGRTEREATKKSDVVRATRIP